MRSFIGGGKLKGDALVWCHGMKGWTRIVDVEPFRSYFKRTVSQTNRKKSVQEKLGKVFAFVIIIGVVLAMYFWVFPWIFGQSSSRAPTTAAEYKNYVTPNDSTVQATLSSILANKPVYRTDFGAIQEWVSTNTTYVSDTGEYWQTPKETIERGKGGREDFSILFCSLLRANGVPSNSVYVVAGTSSEGGHAYVAENYRYGTWRYLEPQASTSFWSFLDQDELPQHAHTELYYFNDVVYNSGQPF